MSIDVILMSHCLQNCIFICWLAIRKQNKVEIISETLLCPTLHTEDTKQATTTKNNHKAPIRHTGRKLDSVCVYICIMPLEIQLLRRRGWGPSNRFSTAMFLISNRIGCLMISVFASSSVDRGFELQLGRAKYCKITICCLPTKHEELRSKN